MRRRSGLNRRVVATMLTAGFLAGACATSPGDDTAPPVTTSAPAPLETTEGTGTDTSTTPAPQTTSTAVPLTVPAGARPLALASSAPLEHAPLGIKIDWPRRSAYADFYELADGAPAYYHLTWCDIETDPGIFDWERPDEWVAWHLDRNARLGIKITIGSCWATGGLTAEPRGALRRTPSTLPTDLDAYADFVTSVVERYGPSGVVSWAIENEVDAPNFWVGSMDDYALVAGTASEAIRSADPSASVLDAGLTSVGHGSVLVARALDADGPATAIELYNSFFARRIGSSSRYPAISDEAELLAFFEQPVIAQQLSAHATMTQLHLDGVVDVVQLHHYEGPEHLPAVIELIRSDLGSVDIEVWELGLFGLDGENEARAMTLATDTVRTALELGVTAAIWLPAAAEPGDEQRWGALTPDLEPRSLLRLAEALAAATRGDARVGPLAGGGGLAVIGPERATVLAAEAAATPTLFTNHPDGVRSMSPSDREWSIVASGASTMLPASGFATLSDGFELEDA